MKNVANVKATITVKTKKKMKAISSLTNEPSTESGGDDGKFGCCWAPLKGERVDERHVRLRAASINLDVHFDICIQQVPVGAGFSFNVAQINLLVNVIFKK